MARTAIRPLERGHPRREISHDLHVTSGADSVPGLPDYWFGTLRIESSDQPINAMVQLTNILVPTGDTYAAHNVFPIP